jgi:hypothetical protein
MINSQRFDELSASEAVSAGSVVGVVGAFAAELALRSIVGVDGLVVEVDVGVARTVAVAVEVVVAVAVGVTVGVAVFVGCTIVAVLVG